MMPLPPIIYRKLKCQKCKKFVEFIGNTPDVPDLPPRETIIPPELVLYMKGIEKRGSIPYFCALPPKSWPKGWKPFCPKCGSELEY
ncbi:MAG: hypothetical protein ABII22_06700 [Candidatus Micrarchaeota archaeon]